MKNHQSREYKFIREHVLFIYNANCTLCGFHSMKNHTHHVDGNSRNNNPFNFAVLCETCHRRALYINMRVIPPRSETQMVQIYDLMMFMHINFKTSLR